MKFFTKTCVASFLFFFVLLFVSPYLYSADLSLEDEQKTEDTVKSDDVTTADDVPLYSFDEPEAKERSTGGLLLSSLLVVAFLGLGFYLFFRFVTKQSIVPLGGQGVLKNLAVMPMGQNRALQVVELGSKLLVLGVGDNGITLIKEITEKDEIERIKLQSASALVTDQGGFQVQLKKQVDGLLHFLNVSKFPKSAGRKSAPVKEEVFYEDEGPDILVSSNDEKTPAQSDDTFEKDFSRKRSFFDDERSDYLKRQKQRLRNLNGFYDEN